MYILFLNGRLLFKSVGRFPDVSPSPWSLFQREGFNFQNRFFIRSHTMFIFCPSSEIQWPVMTLSSVIGSLLSHDYLTISRIYMFFRQQWRSVALRNETSGFGCRGNSLKVFFLNGICWQYADYHLIYPFIWLLCASVGSCVSVLLRGNS